MSELSPDLEKKIELKGMDLNEIGVIIKNLREKPFRAKQLYKWLYRKSAFSFDEMSDLPLILRNYLSKRAELKLLE
ncbi:MAG: bifunctional tRNA (adenosine(37)-C2)-methyltransferase TrmG/ribosomal RNA large subunit methyltransferase RlmN, partial [Candidatus Neomarinimicrobiota bacterium]